MGAKKPLDLLLIEGRKHLSKKEIQERRDTEVVAKKDDIKPPRYLPKPLKKEFTRYAKELSDINIMTNLDCEALARYVMAEANFEKLSVDIYHADPMSMEYDLLMRHQKEFFKQARQAAQDLGLTISSRAKLTVPKKEEDKPKSKEEKRFGGKL